MLAGILFTQLVFCQRYLSGVIKIAGNPVKNLAVYTTFGKRDYTDDLGRYALDISGCVNCKPGSKIEIFTYHEEYGSSVQSCIISNDFLFNFSLIKNPSKIFITGLVQNAVNNEPLEGIEVVIISADIEMYPVKTDSFGQFRIPVSRYQLENKNAVRIMVKDPNRVFKPLKSEPELLEITSFSIIKMRSKNTHKIKVDRLTNTTICVRLGDVVTIEAAGHIRVGTFMGSSDPDGLSAGVMGMSLESYNIVPNFKHAALMYRFAGETEWKVAGKRKRFIPYRDGCLQFQINDNNQDDNYGHYEVELTIEAE